MTSPSESQLEVSGSLRTHAQHSKCLELKWHFSFLAEAVTFASLQLPAERAPLVLSAAHRAARGSGLSEGEWGLGARDGLCLA